jgi:hypothetical protein
MPFLSKPTAVHDVPIRRARGMGRGNNALHECPHGHVKQYLYTPKSTCGGARPRGAQHTMTRRAVSIERHSPSASVPIGPAGTRYTREGFRAQGVERRMPAPPRGRGLRLARVSRTRRHRRRNCYSARDVCACWRPRGGIASRPYNIIHATFRFRVLHLRTYHSPVDGIRSDWTHRQLEPPLIGPITNWTHRTIVRSRLHTDQPHCNTCVRVILHAPFIMERHI